MARNLFVDSDVIISSLLSPSGASYLLLHTDKLEIKLFISNISYLELEIVTERLHIEKQKLKLLIKERFTVVELRNSAQQLKETYGKYTNDPNDAHIVAGAEKTRADFLISYNIKHFKMERIKRDLDSIVTTPGNFLQYLRSIQKG